MIFPNPPGLEELEAMGHGAPAAGQEGANANSKGRKSPSNQHLQIIHESSPPPLPVPAQQHDGRLAALEKYMKELNEEISKKDERIGELESQLRMVRVWADDFAGSLKSKPGVESEQGNGDSTGDLQKQLTRLQSKIENGFRALEANAYEMKIKAEEAEIAKNKALEFTATTLANTSAVAPQQQQQQQQRRPRAGSDRSRTNMHNNHSNESSLTTHHSNHSDLNMMLNDSLVELDHQISLTGSSSSSMGSNSSTTPDMNDRRARSPSVPHQYHRQDLPRGTSRSRQAGGAQQLQPQQQHQLPQQQQQHDNKDDLALGDAQEEIRRLNLMVDELERLIRLKMNV